MATPNYRFPVLDVGELVQNFKQQIPGIELTDADFRNPKADRWQAIYTGLLEELADISPERLLQADFGMQMENPEMYEEAMPLFKMVIFMRRIIQTCDIDDFSMTDVTDPSLKRLQRNMSAILNFLYFRTEPLERYEAIKEEQNSQLKMRDAVIKENMDIQAEINRIRSERAEQEPINNEVQQKIEDLQNYMIEMRETTNQKRKSLQDTKERIAEKNARLADMKARIAAAKEEGVRLSAKIVTSPDRLREKMDRMQHQLRQLQVVKEERRTRLIEIQQMKEDLRQIEINCEHALDLVNKIKSEAEQQKEQVRVIQTMRDKLIEKRDELQDMEAQEQQMHRVISTKQEKLSKLTLTYNNKKQSMGNTRQVLIDEKEILQTQQEEDSVQKEAISQAFRAVMEEEQVDNNRHEQLIHSMQAKYAELLEQLEIYHKNLMSSWQKVSDFAECSNEEGKEN